MARTWFTEEELEAALLESCERSGVPLKIEDPAILAKIAKVSSPRQAVAS